MDWDELALALRVSSVRQRLAVLDLFEKKLVTDQDTESASQALFPVYPLYHDRASRRRVSTLLPRLSSSTLLLRLYTAECHRPALARSNALVLLHWGAILLADHQFDLLPAWGLLLEICLRQPPRPRKGVQGSALRTVRHGLQILTHTSSPVSTFVSHLLSTASSLPSPYRLLPLVGLMTQGCDESVHKQIMAFYLKEVAGSKTSVPPHIACSLSAFFRTCSAEVFETELAPTLEKALLRSPEVLLDGVLVSLVESLPLDADLSSTFAQRFEKALLGHIRSSNSVISSGSIAAFAAFAARAQQGSLITGRVVKALAEARNPQERLAIGSLLLRLPAGDNSCCQSLLQIIAKESNEACLGIETEALLSFSRNASPTLAQSIIQAAKSALNSTKMSAKCAWIRALGEIFWPFLSETLPEMGQRLLEELAESLKNVCEEVRTATSLPPPSMITAAYTAIVMSPSPGYIDLVVNTKLFQKLAPSEVKWHFRALISTFPGLQKDNEMKWACSVISAFKDRESSNLLRGLYQKAPSKVSSVMLSGIWHWLSNVSHPTTALYQILQSISPSSQPEASRQLIDSLVLLQPSLIPGSAWIQACLNAKIDPAELVNRYSAECWERIRLSLGLGDRKIVQAAHQTAAELAFVSSDAILPLIQAQIARCLEIQDFGPHDVAIWQTPPGTLYHDIRRPAPVVDKKQSDYEIKMWEEEIRQQSKRKLDSEEQAKLNTALEGEAAIRKHVEDIRANLLNGSDLIAALASGPPTETMTWLADALTALLVAISHGAAPLLGNSLFQSYLACTRLGASRLGHDVIILAVATLRTAGADVVGAEFLVEPLADLSLRLLRRLHFLSSQVPFDPVALTVALPFIFQTVEHCLDIDVLDEDAQERLTLSLEFLGFHTDIYHENVHRRKTVDLLVRCVRRFPDHFRLCKDTLNGICRISLLPTEIEILLNGTMVPESSVRTLCLQLLRDFADMLPTTNIRVWLARFDEETAELGREIWAENDLNLDSDAPAKIIQYLSSSESYLRTAAARALAAAVTPTSFFPVLETLQENYRGLIRPAAEDNHLADTYNRKTVVDAWERRSGYALSFQELAAQFPSQQVVPFLNFLVQSQALGDRNAVVRQQMVAAASSIVSIHGRPCLEQLMSLCETALDTSDSSSSDSDLLSEAIIVLYGALAKHLAPNDSRLPGLTQRLLSALETPSESVQFAVASCLPPLVHSVEDITPYLTQIMDQLHHNPKYSARRGAAYGLAGLVKGHGVSTLTRSRILSALRAGLENKKSVNEREGSLFAYELLSALLGPLFEPYVIRAVPQLLSSFGDTSVDVREACREASRACFSQLTSYGVKIVLPTLLDGLDDPQWRSKRGACELLGAMAYLNPQQLAQSLPDIIPPLTNVLNDSHKEVRAAAARSLARFGEVISNPEVKGLVKVLLRALSDATKHTEEALDALIKVSFVHYIDAPSLALIVRILQRGLDDRSSLKRKSSQIIGSLAHLTDKKDILSHLPILVNGLKLAAVDPVPTTRATASKALGSLVERLGEDVLPDLIPSLMNTLKADTGAGDRLGSAQALSEVLAGLGTSRLEESLPVILTNVSSTRASVREGFMSLFIYLPVCFGANFAHYLARIIPPVLSGLADDVESIRETSLRAGRLLVKNFATKSIDLLLPELDRGLADNNYRIRLSSVELVGDLLFNLTGISGRVDEDDAPEAVHSLVDVLGESRRNQILSSLYICRCDTSGLVRAAAVNVWKALVASPRTLKELVPTLTQQIVGRLASANAEKRLIAGNALGELIRKAGDGVLAKLLPVLHANLALDRDQRQGICMALREIAEAATAESLADYETISIEITRKALVDEDAAVREAAAEAFDSLQQVFGKRAVDQVLPYLLELLRAEESAATALSALLTLLTERTRSNMILPNLVPSLISFPMSAFSARAVASLTRVAGAAMDRRLPSILHALVDNLINDREDNDAIVTALDDILLGLDEYEGLNTGMSVMLGLMKHEDHHRRAVANLRLASFFAHAKSDYARYHQDLIRVLLVSFDDSDPAVVQSAWQALSELTKRLRKEEMEALVSSTRQSLLHVGVAGAVLPGFRLIKGPGAILPIFLQGLMNGSAEQRTQSAASISDIVARCDADGLKPFVTQITGPLIRVVSERSVDLKIAILTTLNHLLDKIPTLLKPFLPQLQRTFAKCLGDSSSETLRNRAARALGALIPLAPRVDPLIVELVTGSKVSDVGVRAAMLKALYEVVSKAGHLMNDNSRSLVLGLVDDEDETASIAHAKLFGAVTMAAPQDAQASVRARLSSMGKSRSASLILNALLISCPEVVADAENQIVKAIESDNLAISCDGIMAAGKFQHRGDSIWQVVAEKLNPTQASDPRRLALVVVRTVARKDPSSVPVGVLAPRVFANVRDPVIPIKLAAEAAFMSLFQVVDEDSRLFDEYMATAELAAGPTRSMQDYFKRVTMRLAAQAREQRSAEGGANGLGLTSDEQDDEREIWSVGKFEPDSEPF